MVSVANVSSLQTGLLNLVWCDMVDFVFVVPTGAYVKTVMVTPCGVLFSLLELTLRRALR